MSIWEKRQSREEPKKFTDERVKREKETAVRSQQNLTSYGTTQNFLDNLMILNVFCCSILKMLFLKL